MCLCSTGTSKLRSTSFAVASPSLRLTTISQGAHWRFALIFAPQFYLFHPAFPQIVVPRVMRVSLDVCATTSASRPFVIEQVRVGPVGAQHTTHALLFAELTSVMRSAVVYFSTTRPVSTLPSFLVCYRDCSCLLVLVAHKADLQRWLDSYHTLFTSKCAGCDKILQIAATGVFNLPLMHPYDNPTSAYHLKCYSA